MDSSQNCLYRNVLLFSPTGRFSFSIKVDAVNLMLTIMGIINSVREKSLQDLFIYLISATDPVWSGIYSWAEIL